MSSRAAAAAALPLSLRSGRRRIAHASEYSLLLTATLCLLAFGVVMVFSASSTTQVLGNGGLKNSVYYLKRTVVFAAIGLLLLRILAGGGARFVRRLTPLALFAAVAGLLAALAIGTSVNGSERWIGAGFLQLQPSELAKLALILYAAHVLSSKPKRVGSLQGMMPLLVVGAFSCGLIVLEPDLGTAIVIAFALGATLIAAGARARDVGRIALCLALILLLAVLIEPYRVERLTGFLHPGASPASTGFQALQAKIALGSGGIFGKGLGNGVQKAYYLPEAHTDMIAAVIGEELGLVGIAGLVGLFGIFGLAGFRVAQRARDHYDKLLAAGLTSMILAQAVINLFAVMGLAPLTGVPLPFVSYGNSNLLVSLAAVGLLLGVARTGGLAAGRRGGARRSAAAAGRLRLVDGGRQGPRGRSAASRAKGRDSRGRNRRARGAGHGRRRRASG